MTLLIWTREPRLTKRAGVERTSHPPLAISRLECRAASFQRAGFVGLIALADLLTIIVCFEIIGVAYHAVYLHVGGMAGDFIQDGFLFGSLFLFVNASRLEYLAQKLVFLGSAQEIFTSWNVTSALALLAEFLLKETGGFSRASVLLSYICGFLSLLAVRGIIRVGLKHYAWSGRLRLFRVVLVGSCEELEDFQSTYQPWTSGFDVVASAILRDAKTLADDLALAVALSRLTQPDSIFILSPWANKEWITSAIDAFVSVPAAIHLGPQPLLTRFETAGIHRIAGITSLKVLAHPQSFFTSTLKRSLDLAVSCIDLRGRRSCLGADRDRHQIREQGTHPGPRPARGFQSTDLRRTQVSHDACWQCGLSQPRERCGWPTDKHRASS